MESKKNKERESRLVIAIDRGWGWGKWVMPVKGKNFQLHDEYILEK